MRNINHRSWYEAPSGRQAPEWNPHVVAAENYIIPQARLTTSFSYQPALFPSCREGITWGFGHSHFYPLTAGSGTLHHFGRSQIGFPVCTIYNLWQHNCSTHSFIVLHCSFLSSAFGYPKRGLFLPFLESVVISARMWYNGDSF